MNKSLLLFCSVLLALSGCATPGRQALVKIEESPFSSQSESATDQKLRLLEATAKQDSWRMAVRDVLMGLEAEEAEQNQDWEVAARKWIEVLQLDAGPVAARAFQRWLEASEKTMAQGTSSDVLARLLLAETHEGLTSPWLQKQKLTQLQVLIKKIDEARAIKSNLADTEAWPIDPSAITDDPFWEKAAQLACRREPIDTWVRWESKLPAAKRDYWKGIVAFCKKDYRASAIFIQSALPSLEKDDSSTPLAINAADRLVQAQKRAGRREEAAAAYRIQQRILMKSGVEATQLGWSPFELLRKQVEAGLWVGRMQALLGDYQSARVAVQQSLDQINQSFASFSNLTRAQKISLDEQKADAYHILASRVAFEQRDYAGALAFNRVAQSLPELGKEWRQRLLWNEGWYKYLLDDKPQAVIAWAKLLGELKDDGQLARLCYWIGRSHLELGDEGEADNYFQRLDREFPLSFYTVVALSRLKPGYRWNKRWLGNEEAKKRLSLNGEFKAEAYEADPEASRRLLRAELMILADVQSWKVPLSLDLYRYVSQKGTLLKEIEASVYVTRLLHMSGQHLHAISLTTQISEVHSNLWDEYPEQILIYYPRPHLSSYQRSSAQHYIDVELPLAISRQESSFKADAISPAEAYGLMQIIVPTAEKQANRLGIKLDAPAENLKQVDLNISLGTSYLAELGRRYRGQWPQAFAAYNAGEYVVDAWILRRASSDPILWIEGLSFGETSSYVKNVWRNWEVYRELKSNR